MPSTAAWFFAFFSIGSAPDAGEGFLLQLNGLRAGNRDFFGSLSHKDRAALIRLLHPDINRILPGFQHPAPILIVQRERCIRQRDAYLRFSARLEEYLIARGLVTREALEKGNQKAVAKTYAYYKSVDPTWVPKSEQKPRG